MTYRLNKIGTDVEVFLRDKTSGLPVPVCGLLGGTKKNPRPVLESLVTGFAVQEDNVMAEFNLPPTANSEHWLPFCQEMGTYLEKFFAEKNLEIVVAPSMVFTPDQLQSEQAKTFGCDPDMSIWTLERNQVDPNLPELQTLRTAGGHIHVSFSVDGQPPEIPDITRVVKALDIFLGLPSVVTDEDSTRRKFYGAAGAFRPKPYGLEYRVLSNFWFKNRQLQQWAFYSTSEALQWVSHHRNTCDELFEKHADNIQRAINTSDVSLAYGLDAEFGVHIPKKKSKVIHNEYPPELERQLRDIQLWAGGGEPAEPEQTIAPFTTQYLAGTVTGRR